ncbi:helix-turn-helix domain-containing protein [Streptomyces sp. NPDC050535]|uniref:helix-turn-helix domain-containing protein n=1 Tax=Streptomyces sp. NPDC050535 TaxID=3365626 RepID=UPI003796F331
MTPSDDAPHQVGQQLARRREDLDLTQDAVSRLIGITVTSVSSAERGRATISRSKRATWEQALQLKPGTLTRAYRDGSDLEPLPPPEPERPYADMSDQLERTAWEMPIDVEHRRLIVDMLREAKARGLGEQRSA